MVRYGWLLGLFLLSVAVRSEPLLRMQLEGSYSDNLNNANLNAEKKSDYAESIQLGAGQIFRAANDDALSATAVIDAENYHEFTGLNATGAGLQIGYTHKFGLGLEQPRFHIAAEASHHSYRDPLRNGWLYTASVGFSKYLQDNWRGQIFYIYERRTQDHVEAEIPGLSGAVFDQSAHTLAADIRYFYNDATALGAGYSRRSGDVTSTTRPALGVYQVSSAVAEDNVFGDDFYAYRLWAVAHTAYIEISEGVNAHNSINLRFQRRLTYGAGDFNYYDSWLSLNWLYEY